MKKTATELRAELRAARERRTHADRFGARNTRVIEMQRAEADIRRIEAELRAAEIIGHPRDGGGVFYDRRDAQP